MIWYNFSYFVTEFVWMHEFANKVSVLTGVSHKEAIGFVKVIPLEYRNHALIALNEGTTIEQVRYIFTNNVLAEAWIRDYVNRMFIERSLAVKLK